MDKNIPSEVWNTVSDLVDEIFNKHMKGKEIMDSNETQMATLPETTTARWTTIDEYKEATGKRYRMTREQKQRGISREEAFQEFLQESENRQ